MMGYQRQCWIQRRRIKTAKPVSDRRKDRNVDIRPLKAILINARSLINKIQELESVQFQENPDIIFITESWAEEKHSLAELRLNGYDCIRKDRNRRGGGCILYVKEELKAIPLQALSDTADTDSVWCKIEDVTFGVCYNTLQTLLKRRSHCWSF